MTSPAANGPMKLETAGPIASQENQCQQRNREPGRLNVEEADHAISKVEEQRERQNVQQLRPSK